MYIIWVNINHNSNIYIKYQYWSIFSYLVFMNALKFTQSFQQFNLVNKKSLGKKWKVFMFYLFFLFFCFLHRNLCLPVQSLRVDPDEAGTLLVALWSHAFDQFELLPVDERTVLLSPLCDAPSSARVQPCYMPTEGNKLKRKMSHSTCLITFLETLHLSLFNSVIYCTTEHLMLSLKTENNAYVFQTKSCIHYGIHDCDLAL